MRYLMSSIVLLFPAVALAQQYPPPIQQPLRQILRAEQPAVRVTPADVSVGPTRIVVGQPNVSVEPPQIIYEGAQPQVQQSFSALVQPQTVSYVCPNTGRIIQRTVAYSTPVIQSRTVTYASAPISYAPPVAYASPFLAPPLLVRRAPFFSPFAYAAPFASPFAYSPALFSFRFGGGVRR